MEWRHYKDFQDVCELACIDEKSFTSFKSSGPFREILENVSESLGKTLFEKLQLAQFPPELWHELIRNDEHGNPLRFEYPGVQNTLLLSPTTLRYIYFGKEMVDEMLKNKLDNIHIIEIGGGYGGQAYILDVLCRFFNIRISSYCLLDHPSVCTLQLKYLNMLLPDVKNVFLPAPTNVEEIDYCISNYCFGEITKSIQDFYWTTIVEKAKHGFMIYNTQPVYPKFVSSSSSALKFTVVLETPQTGRINVKITW